MSSGLDVSAIQASFLENGFYLAKRVFNATELIELETDFDRIVRQITDTGESVNARWSGPEMERLNAGGTVVTHTHNVQKFSAVWMRAMLHPKFLGAAEAIIGEDIILHHSKLFQKPAENGAPFPMHQDWDYFPTVKDTMIAGIIHVSKATDEMGCLRVYPGSHKLGRLEQSNGNSDALIAFPLQNAVPIETEPGDVIFFHYFLIHGSMPNRANEIRKTVLVQLHSGDDQVEEGVHHPNERLVLQGFNHHAKRSTVNE
jgi:phytanoyl-CoA hydroxylase